MRVLVDPIEKNAETVKDRLSRLQKCRGYLPIRQLSRIDSRNIWAPVCSDRFWRGGYGVAR